MKKFYPLINALLFIAFLGWALVRGDFSWMEYMRTFMGLFFVMFAGLKFLDLKGFVKAFKKYDLVAARSTTYAYIYPVLELMLGVAYLSSMYLFEASIVTAVIMFVGAIGVVNAVWIKKIDLKCACMGTKVNLPMTTVTIIEDLAMGAMALGMLFWL